MTQTQIRAQMAANSAAWHTADTEEKDRLHAANVQLAGQLDALTGGSSAFGQKSGVWALSNGGSAPRYETGALPQPTDESEYVNRLYEAKTEQSLLDLQQAYESSALALGQQEQGLSGQYQTAKNQAAAQSAIGAKNFHETAAAGGLGSGAAAQADLVRGVALQGNLNDLRQSEVSDRVNLQLQRAKLLSEYEMAFAKAKAQGATGQAEALYQERVRLDEALRAAAQSQEELNFRAFTTNSQLEIQARQDAAANAQWDHEQTYAAQRDLAEDQRRSEETAYARQQAALQQAREKDADAFDRAMKRWETLGYLDEAGARILGLPKGTRTSDALYQAARIFALRT